MTTAAAKVEQIKFWTDMELLGTFISLGIDGIVIRLDWLTIHTVQLSESEGEVHSSR